LSAVFRSSSTGLWKVAVSTPIYQRIGEEMQVRGVLAMTVSLGDFAYFRSNNRPDRFAALIDGRPGPNFGVILQHPLLDRLNLDNHLPGEDFAATKYRINPNQLDRIIQDETYLYQDPLSSAPGGEVYRGEWIAAIDRVRLPDGAEESEDMIVLVQERYDEATQTVKQLGGRLKEEGLWALAGVAGVIAVLWYIVLRVLSESHLPKRAPARKESQPLPALSTIPAASQKD
jgi:eukaryotic-like serine/threonine-protein kinase